MEYSQLQRDFKEKDVQRLRNLITEKYGEKTITQIGHIKKEIDHVEGDIWEENDKTWTIKDGLLQTYTKLDDLKKALRMPLACPKCKKAMKHPYDKNAYSLHNECFDCVIKRETLMRHEGTFQRYSDEMYINNVASYIDEAIEYIEDYSEQKNESVYTENGEEEKFVGGKQKDTAIELMKKQLESIKENLLAKKNQHSNT